MGAIVWLLPPDLHALFWLFTIMQLRGFFSRESADALNFVLISDPKL